MTRQRSRPDAERGSAAVEFALVAPLVLVIALAVVQLAFALHVRATLVAAAAEGARVAARADGGAAAGIRRTREVLADNVAAGAVGDITAAMTSSEGLAVAEVRVTAHVPLLGLLGPTAMTVAGHSVLE
ncbi:MAG: pilus assembly protein [Actinomycetota bacterium]|nr:MAG: pilus assembly protein [Actinomycetota bacterium]